MGRRKPGKLRPVIPQLPPDHTPASVPPQVERPRRDPRRWDRKKKSK